MAEVKLYANQSAAINYINESYNNHDAQVFTGTDLGIMSFALDSPISPYNKITSIALWLYFEQIYKYYNSFDEPNVTYANKPGAYSRKALTLPGATINEYKAVGEIASTSAEISRAIKYGLMFQCDDTVHYYSSHSDNKPYLTIKVTDELATGTIQDFSPAVGSIVDLSKPVIFTFSFTQNTDEPSLEELKVASFTLQLRVHGQSMRTKHLRRTGSF